MNKQSKEEVKKTFDRKAQEVIERLGKLGYERNRILGAFLYGSQNYGMSTEKSDFDFKVIVFPEIDDLLFKRTIAKTYQLNDTEEDQIEVKDINEMLNMWRKGNPAYLEILGTEYFFTDYPDAIEALRSFNPATVNNIGTVNALYGMALQKLKALDHPYPSKIKLIEEYGYDSKQLSHIFRLDFALDHMYNELIVRTNKNFCVNDYTLNPTEYERDIVLDIKDYKYSLTEARNHAERKLKEMKTKKEAMLQSKSREVGSLEFNIDIWNKMRTWMLKLMRENLKTQILEGKED